MQKYLKLMVKHKYLIGIIIINILLYAQMFNVRLYADEYSILDRIPDAGFSHIVDEIVFFFQLWSGRLIGHFVVVLGLHFTGTTFFAILHPIFISLLCYFLSKIIKLYVDIPTTKLMFFMNLIIIGFPIIINNQLLYWSYSGVLYLWGYVLATIVLYKIYSGIINHKAMDKNDFLKCIICIVVIGFTMESTLVFIIINLFIYLIYQHIKKIDDKRVLILEMISILIIILLLFIPGNINRSKEEFAISTLNKINFNFEMLTTWGTMLYKYILMIGLVLNVYFIKKNKILSSIMFILSLLIFVDISIYDFMNTFVQNCMVVIYITFLVINIICLIKKDFNIILCLTLSAIITTILNTLIVSYATPRFYFITIIYSMILVLHYYFKSNEKEKILMIILFTSIWNYVLCISLLIIFIVLSFTIKKMNIFKRILFIIFITLNVYVLLDTYMKYKENAKIIDNNDKIIMQIKEKEKQIDENNEDDEQIDETNENEVIDTIHLKKIKYPEYAYQLPDNFDYVLEWYVNYYGIYDYEVVFED